MCLIIIYLIFLNRSEYYYYLKQKKNKKNLILRLISILFGAMHVPYAVFLLLNIVNFLTLLNNMYIDFHVNNNIINLNIDLYLK